MSDDNEVIAAPERQPSGPQRVRELNNFPFPDFATFKRACNNHEVTLRVDYRTATGYTSPAGLLCQALIFAAVLGFVVFTILSKSWWLFLALPLFAIGYLVFHPAGTFTGARRPVAALVCLIALVWALYTHQTGVLAITMVLLIIWVAHRMTIETSMRSIVAQSLGDEKGFCLGWLEQALYLRSRYGVFYNSKGSYFEGGRRSRKAESVQDWYDACKIALYRYLKEYLKEDIPQGCNADIVPVLVTQRLTREPVKDSIIETASDADNEYTSKTVDSVLQNSKITEMLAAVNHASANVYLTLWADPLSHNGVSEHLELARSHIDRALALDPSSTVYRQTSAEISDALKRRASTETP